jgi:uncharacterized protein (TIGR00255 family)
MKSMTGMGRAGGVVQGSSLRVEIKAVNHRFCEVSVRLPGRFSLLEIPLRQFVKGVVQRGKVDVFVAEDRTPEVSSNELAAFRQYRDYLERIRADLGITQPVDLNLLITGVGSVPVQVDLDAAWRELEPVVRHAVSDLDRMRSDEGLRLKQEIKDRFLTIEEISGNVFDQSATIRSELEQRLNKRIKERALEIAEIDPLRLQSEVVFYLDRMDITEELGRLKSHLAQVEVFLSSPEAVGRKMDFLLQEMNREFNTVASKVQNTGVAIQVVTAKAELEKIREQIQNIE